MHNECRTTGFVSSNNPIIVSSIEAMKELVVSRGGYVHPAACIEEQDGTLRTVCHAPLAHGQPLFRIPDALLVPIDTLSWTDSDQTMRLSKPPSDLSIDQANMLDLFITIYNSAGKLRWSKGLPTILLSTDIELAAQVDLVMPDSAIKAPTLAAAFLKTRSYSSKHAQAGLAGKNCIMPLVDFMNHNLAGSDFWHADGILQLDINHSLESEECFANYGIRCDPLALALGYGYLDPLAPFSRSVPAVMEFAGFGRLEVAGQGIITNHWADPPRVEFFEDGLTLSHLAGDARSPQRLQATLRLAMMASGKRRGIPDAVTERALAELPAAILAANREKLAAFRAYLATRPELPLATLLSDASLCQLANLEKILAT